MPAPRHHATALLIAVTAAATALSNARNLGSRFLG
jgi:hypothetical protein